MSKVLLQVNTVAGRGSTGNIVDSICKMARLNGWECFTAYGRGSRLVGGTYIKLGSFIDVIIHGAYSLLLNRHGYASKAATYKLIRWIDLKNPNVIHLHNLHGYYLNFHILFEYLSRRKIPVVITAHDFWYITGHCTYFSRVDCSKWLGQCGDCPQLRSYPISLFFDRSSENHSLKRLGLLAITSLHVVTLSQWQADIFKKSFLSKREIRTISNGIDLEVFRRWDNRESVLSTFGINLEVKVLLAVASKWDKRKGLDDYFILAKMLPSDFVIVLVGLEDSKRLSGLVNVLGIPIVHDKRVLAGLYSIADVLLNLSYEETFGLTTVESMACGTPVIVYDNSACSELISNDTGIVVQRGDIIGVESAVREIILNKSQFNSANCRKRVELMYDESVVYRKYLDLYDEVIS